MNSPDHHNEAADHEASTSTLQNSTLHAYSVALLSLASKHKSTDACTADILRLFSTMVPSANPLPSTLYLLIKKFLCFKEGVIVHHCCGCCTKLLENDQECDSTFCRISGSPNATFIEVKLDKQLQTLFSGIAIYTAV